MAIPLCWLNWTKDARDTRLASWIKACNDCSAVVCPPSESAVSLRAIVSITVFNQYLKSKKNVAEFALLTAENELMLRSAKISCSLMSDF